LAGIRRVVPWQAQTLGFEDRSGSGGLRDPQNQPTARQAWTGPPPQADSAAGDRLRLPDLFRSRSPISNATRDLENHRHTNRPLSLNQVVRKK